MRKHVKVAALSLAVFAGACGTKKESTAALPDDLQKDLAAASAPGSDLATAPKSFEKTQVVSAMERTSGTTRVKVIAKSKRHTKPMLRPEPVNHPAEMVAAADVAGTSEMAPSPTEKQPVPSDLPTIPEPVATTPRPGSEPAPGPVPTGGSGQGGAGSGRRGGGIGGLGGIFGGIIGAVVIRGGHGGVDHCDPRTDGRSRTGGIYIMGPNSGMPLPTGTFPRRFARGF